jgi:hypothetical protein
MIEWERFLYAIAYERVVAIENPNDLQKIGEILDHFDNLHV